MKQIMWISRLCFALLVLLGSSSLLAQTSAGNDWNKVFAPTAKARLLNLDDPATQKAYHEMLKQAGAKPSSHARLYQLTGKGARPASKGAVEAEPVFALLGFATDDAGANVASSAVIATRDKTHSITLTLVITDALGKVLTSAMKDDKTGPSSVAVTTDPAVNTTKGDLTAVGTASVVYADGSFQVYYVAGEAESYPTAVANVAPMINPAAPRNKAVQVCINRATAAGAPPEACNYVLASTADIPDVQLPVAGSATYAGAIDVGARGKPKDATATLMIVDPRSNAACQYVDLGEAFFDDPSVKVDGSTLSWSLDPAKFAESCPIADVPYLFALSIQVSVQGKQAWATVTNAVTTSTLTTLAIPAVRLVAGCVAKGTRVSLADGTARAVEMLKVGDRLKSQNGDLAIAAIAAGTRSEAVTLTLEGGDSLQASLIHPVPTARGVIQAQDLRLGDGVTTLDGASKVNKIVAEILARPIEVYDLVLTPAQVSSEQGSTFYAGGILVGDGAMKATLVSAKAKGTTKEHQP
jgi:hypothetical protein